MTDFFLLVTLPLGGWIVSCATFAAGAALLFQTGAAVALRAGLWGGLIGLGIWATLMFLITVTNNGRRYFFGDDPDAEGGIVTCVVYILIALPATIFTAGGVFFFWAFVRWLVSGGG